MASPPLYVFIFYKEKIVHDNILSIRLVERIDLLCVGQISIKGDSYRNCPARSFRAAGGTMIRMVFVISCREIGT